MQPIVSSLLSPTEPSDRGRRIALAGLRLLVGALWLYNVVWKRPPSFGRDNGGQLFGYVQGAVDEPFFPPYSWLLEHLVLPNFGFFGWVVLVVESLLAAFLITGVYTRVWALVGAGQALAIGLSVVTAPGEWPWGYYMLVGIHLVLFATAAGAYAGVDGVRARAGTSVWRGLMVAGVTTLIAGAVSLAFALSTDPFAGVGEGLQSNDLELSLGRYNVLGALLLLVLGALLVVASRRRSRTPALAAGAVGLLATILGWLQLASGDGWLGADGTGAAAYLTVAVAALGLATLVGADQPADRRGTTSVHS